MKYCGLVVDDCVLEPTTIGKTLEWDLKDRCLSLTNAVERQLKLLEGRYSHVDIKNAFASDLSLIIESFRCLDVACEIGKLSNKLDTLLEEKCKKAITEN